MPWLQNQRQNSAPISTLVKETRIEKCALKKTPVMMTGEISSYCK